LPIFLPPAALSPELPSSQPAMQTSRSRRSALFRFIRRLRHRSQ
jgi:hypothetical protein